MVRNVDGWAEMIVRGWLEGMGNLADENLDIRLEADIRLTFSRLLEPVSPSLTACRRLHERFIPVCIRTIDR
jgi:hypothetical protein